MARRRVAADANTPYRRSIPMPNAKDWKELVPQLNRFASPNFNARKPGHVWRLAAGFDRARVNA
jgi:hypothetical protein